LALTASPQVYAGEFKKASFEISPVAIHFWEKGQGEPLILLFGLFSGLERLDPDRFGFLADELSTDFRVIIMEMRGHGQSGKPRHVTGYGAEMATDVVRLMDHLGLKTAHVMGYSYGAMLAGKLLETHPERLRSVVLGGASFSDIDKPAHFEWALRYADSIEQGKGLELLVRDITPPGQEVDQETIDFFNRKYLAPNDPAAMVAVLRATQKLGINIGSLARTKVPVLMAVGEFDPNSAEASSLKERFPNLNVLVAEGKDHLTAPTAPEFIEGVKSFLERSNSLNKE
jgi:pimeloyl-ACP methyl ester carboxylesterase